MANEAHALDGKRVFISYPRGGAAHTWAEKVQAHLEQRGARVWRDEHAVEPGGDNWRGDIERGLRDADVVVSVIDTNSQVCRWQEREVLLADQCSLPVIAFRVSASASMPFYILEKQPIDVEGLGAAESLAVLASRIAGVGPGENESMAPATDQPATVVPTAQRRREAAYLRRLLGGRLSDREERYVSVGARERVASSLARSHKGTWLDTTALLRAFSLDATAAVRQPDKTYGDVLEAYRDLPQRRIRRLVVLGEPGAGKTFSLERIAVDYAQQALADPRAPLPLFISLGLWTRAAEALESFIERQLDDLGPLFQVLRDQRRAVVLLDAMNEIPANQRHQKAAQIRALAEDERFASVVVSCRERDFVSDFALPFDTLTLQALEPPQVLRFLQCSYALDPGGAEGERAGEARFWEIAGGAPMREAWNAWQGAGASFETFWSAANIPGTVYEHTSVEMDIVWRDVRDGPRSLIRLASNPYLLLVMRALPTLPANRVQLFEGFLNHLFDRERLAREARHDTAIIPDRAVWERELVNLAERLQAAQPPSPGSAEEAAGVTTALSRGAWPPTLTQELVNFSIDASVLRLDGDQLRFTHQLLQEALTTRVLLRAAADPDDSARRFWPASRWWLRTGWEVVAQLGAESLGKDTRGVMDLVRWLAEANPEVAAEAWRASGSPALSPEVAGALVEQLAARMIDEALEPEARARAAIGRALGLFGLDRRKGIGLREDGLPDIDWVTIRGRQRVSYQEWHSLALPTFEIARYPITNAQFQAFIDADGYDDERWWPGLENPGVPQLPDWSEPNSPRESVDWYEARAFCLWLAELLGDRIELPTERQWERAACGADGFSYPWGTRFEGRRANMGRTIGRTTAVGIYPHPSAEGVHDLAGNVFEWCLDESWETPYRFESDGIESRAIRGSSWDQAGSEARCMTRFFADPGTCSSAIGFRVCRISSPSSSVAQARRKRPRTR